MRNPNFSNNSDERQLLTKKCIFTTPLSKTDKVVCTNRFYVTLLLDKVDVIMSYNLLPNSTT